MDSRRGKIRKNVEGYDRLSSLPDDLIRKILSFNGTKEAIQTSVLSSRWRHTWTSMPGLDLESNSFRTLNVFSKFVKDVLANRNNQIDVSSVKLEFRGKVSQVFVKRILEYAFSHNVQQMDISCLSPKKTELSLSLFCSPSLKHLTLCSHDYEDIIVTPRTLELQALTTLNLHGVTLNDDSTDKRVGFFSNCANLKNLTLKKCELTGLNGFSICHPGLSSLTLEDSCNGVNVDTPQLKNLTIKYSSLQYGVYDQPVKLSSNLLLLEKADICVYFIFSKANAIAQKIVCLLQQLHSVQFLTLDSQLIELLSSSVEVIAQQSSPFANLKSLKIYPSYGPYELLRQLKESGKKQTQREVTISTEVRNYLLNSSPGVTFTVVSHEERRAVENVTPARILLRHHNRLHDI